MTTPTPKVTIGLPVFNGENFLAEAVESILTQTFMDFELVISDNASTDRTEQICRDFAARDSRIRYFRNNENMGASWNFNRVFELARGVYFKWAAHDDRCEPEYLERCVKVLDENAEVVLAYPRALSIDMQGNLCPSGEHDLHEDAPDPWERFRFLIWVEHGCTLIFGLIRADVLRKTPLMGSYIGSDRILIAELSLHGPFRRIPEMLFIHRDHAARSVRAYELGLPRLAWFDPRVADRKPYPYWRMFKEYFKAAGRSPLGPVARARCFFQMLRWVKRHRKDLIGDLDFFSRPTAITGSSESGGVQTPTDQLSSKQ